MESEYAPNPSEEPEKSAPSPLPRRRFTPPRMPRISFSRSNARYFGLAVAGVILALVVGLVGGVTGFVALSSDSSLARSVRSALNISQKNPLPLSTTSKVTLEESSQVIDAATKVRPAVVSISGSQQVADFFGQTSTEVSGGTGFIISSDGLIVTNKHVVSGAGTSYKVVLDDGRIFDAKVQATDPLNDLALVKIDAKDLPTVEFGSSDGLKVGQYVLAIGNALGEFQNSVSLGIISGKGRSISAGDQASTSTDEELTDVLQTDAAINPGNSGGPLVNMNGQVVGIDTAIATNGSGSGSIGIGFAIPIDSVLSVINTARQTGTIIRPYMGVRYIPVTTSFQQTNNLSVSYGAYVTGGSSVNEPAVVPGSPADKAGIQSGDILLQINGEQINQQSPLTNLLQKYQPGDTITVHLMRKGAESDVKVTLDKLNQ